MSRSAARALAAVLAVSGCATPEDSASAEVEAQQIDGVWVFTYATDPSSSMDALHGGEVVVIDGCMQVGDAVVVWRDLHLDDVEDLLAGVASGEVASVQIGGGGLSLDEGSTLDDFPDAVLEHCAPTELWFASSEALTVDATP